MVSRCVEVRGLRLRRTSTHLIHKLHSIRKQHSSSSLYFISLKQLTPSVFSMLFLNFQRFKHFSVLLFNLRIIRRAVIDITENLQRFLMAPVFVEITRRLREAKDEDNDALNNFY